MTRQELDNAIINVMGEDTFKALVPKRPSLVQLAAIKLFTNGDIESQDAQIIREALKSLEKHAYFVFEEE